MENLKQINLNHYIYVRVKENGWAHWLKSQNKGMPAHLIMSMEKLKSCYLRPNGLCAIQIHTFIDIFGGTFIDSLVDMNVCFEEKDLKDYVPETKD